MQPQDNQDSKSARQDNTTDANQDPGFDGGYMTAQMSAPWVSAKGMPAQEVLGQRHLSLASSNTQAQTDAYKHAQPHVVVAYQPLVDVSTQQTVAYEALIRRSGFLPAGAEPNRLGDEVQHQLDMLCRHKAMAQACELGLHQREGTRLSLAILPDAIYNETTGVAATLAMADKLGFPRQRLIFDISEREYVRNPELLRQIFAQHSSHQYQTAITDFGSGHSGLGLLADFQPDLVKLDRRLVRNLHNNFVRREIVDGIVRIAQRLGITVVAQGVESKQERNTLRDIGVCLMQGNLFAQAALERLPEPHNFEG